MGNPYINSDLLEAVTEKTIMIPKYELIVPTSQWRNSMDNPTAIQLIRSLANGTDPITGEIISDTSSLNDPKLIRAFFLAVDALEYVEKKGKTQKQEMSKYTNAGKPWTSEEDNLLIQAFEKGVAVKEIVQRHGRTRGALAARLVRLGKIADRADFLYVRTQTIDDNKPT
jgi:hypothetical protein